MKKNNYLNIILSIFTALFLSIMSVQNNAQSKSTISVSLAKFNVLQNDNNAFEMRFEYREYDKEALVSPFGGVMFNMSGAYNFYGGIMKDLHLFGNLFLTPSFAPGIYIKGYSKDLSYALEFRSQIELTYQLENGVRIGINMNHISNGGLRLPNVGVESLGLSYIVPF